MYQSTDQARNARRLGWTRYMSEWSTFLRLRLSNFSLDVRDHQHSLSHLNRLTNNERDVHCTYLRIRVTDTNVKKIEVRTKPFANLKPNKSINEREEEKSQFVLSHLSREMFNEDFLIVSVINGEITFCGRTVIPQIIAKLIDISRISASWSVIRIAGGGDRFFHFADSRSRCRWTSLLFLLRNAVISEFDLARRHRQCAEAFMRMGRRTFALGGSVLITKDITMNEAFHRVRMVDCRRNRYAHLNDDGRSDSWMTIG